MLGERKLSLLRTKGTDTSMSLAIDPPTEAHGTREGRCPHCRTRLEKQEGGFLFVKNAIIKVDLKTRLAAAKCPQCKRWVEVPLQLLAGP